MESWRTGKKFLTLLEADKELMKRISKEELGAIFDYKYYLTHIDTIFQRLGLTANQWKVRPGNGENANLAPGAI